MSLTCKLSRAEESILINLCEDKMTSISGKECLSVAEKEEQLQVYEVYNKLILGLDYSSTKVEERPNTVDSKLRALITATVKRVQEIEIAGSVDVMIDSPTSIFISIFPVYREMDFEENPPPWVYLISFDVTDNKIQIEAGEEFIEEIDYPRFLSSRLEEDLKEELS